jgi:ketosteroid isomerase-like protein
MVRPARTLHAVASLLLLLGLAAPAAAQQTQDTTRLPESLRTARASMSAALTKLDPAAAAALFTDDGAVEFAGEALTGRAAVQRWFADALSGVTSLNFSPATFEITADQVTERANYVVGVPEGEQGGMSKTIWTRQADGSWKVTRLIVS